MAKYFKFDPSNIVKQTYPNGRMALSVMNPYEGFVAVLTVNIPEIPLEKGNVFIKDWGENEGVLQDLLDYELVEKIDEFPYNFVKVHRCKWLKETS